MRLIAIDAKGTNLSKVKNNIFFGVSGKETTDVQNKPIFSVAHQTLDDCLNVDEMFSSVCAIENKLSETTTNKLKVSRHADSHKYN